MGLSMDFDDIPLTPQQSDIVACLVENEGRPMRCRQIAAEIGGSTVNTVKVQVCRIRRVFEDEGATAQIQSMAGGYILREVQP